MFAASKTGSAAAKDAQFKNVTMLLHGDGTNGAQNNTFLDSSTNNFTITRNGNTTQGTFTPYGSNWSNYFDGSGDYLSVASNAANALGAGNFTIQFWFYLTGTTGVGSSGEIGLVGCGDTSTSRYTVRCQGTGTRVMSWWLNTPSNNVTGTTAIILNTWYHVALVRNGSGTNNVKLYLNGTLESQGTSTYNSPADNISIGRGYPNLDGEYTNGYISNLQMVVGTALYTSNFTPSTTPLTAVTNTSLLTCQSNRFIDNSTNNFTITKNGDVSVQRFSPFSPTTAYSTSVIGGSSYMDGTGDYLYLPNNSALSFGTGDFCVEAYVYKQRAANEPIIDSRATNNASPWAIYIDGSNLPYFYEGTSYTSSIAITLNAWTHVAVTRSSGTLKIFVNGVQGYSGTVTTNLDRASGNQVIGATVVTFANPWLGYMNDFRVVKGSAVYTSAFTPPTAPLTAITNTSLLLSYTNVGILDNAMMNDLETVGNAQISTSVKKYGTGSLAFDGNGDYLAHPFTPAINFSSGSFTIECWVYPTTNQTDNWIYGVESGGTGYYVLRVVTTNKLQFTWNNFASSVTSTGTLSLNTWTHIAVSCTGSTVTLYINGTSDGSTSISGITAAPSGTQGCVGNQIGQSRFWNGNIDDLRITRGVARYTANFTAPTAAFSNN